MRNVNLLGILAVSSMLAICQCGPNVENLSIDSEFQKTSLDGSTIVIGGLTSMVGKENSGDIDTEAGAQVFRDKLGEKMAGVNVIPSSVAKDAFGENGYWQILEDYNLNLRLSESDLAKLSEKFSNEKAYLVLARLESYSQWNHKGETKDSTGKVLNKYLQSNRKLTAKFNLWDLRTLKQVWSGQISGTAIATNNYPQVKGVDWSELGLIGDIINMSEEIDRQEEEKSYVYPDMPSFYWASGTLFSEFAKALQKK